MELKRLEIEGFKKFSAKKVFNFKKGINLIHGDNEKGKSTILEAVLASVGDLTPKEIEEVKNWESDKCYVSLTYETDKGETFRIERDFLERTNFLSRKENKKFERVASNQKRISQLMKDHFGIVDKKLLRSTIFVGSREVSKIGEESDLLKENLSTLIAGATANPVSKAIKKLKKERKELKYYKGKGGELYELQSQLEDAEETLNQAREDEKDVNSAEKELRKKRKELGKKEEDANALQSLLEKYDHRAELKKREGEVREQLKTLREMPKTGKKDPSFLYAGSAIIVISIILGAVLSPWTVTSSLIGFVFIYLYFKQEEKVQIPDNLKEQNEKLSQNLAAVQFELKKYEGIKLDPEEVERKRNKLKKLKEDIDDLSKGEASISSLESRIKTLKSRSYDLAAAIADKENLIHRIEEQKDMIKAYDMASEVMSKAESEAYEKISPKLSKNASKTISVITDNKYTEFKITSDLEMKVKIPDSDKFTEIKFPLSDGTQDQLYLAARLAVSEVLSGGRKLPLLLDESLAFFDYNRFTNCMKLIKTLSKKYSVFISSLDNKYDKFADNVISL
ncbi:MAG: ATP-binding protein [Candidatus Aminicenantaceae bacterium]